MAEIEDGLEEIEADPDLSQVGTIFKIILEDTVDKIAEASIEMIIIEIVVTIEAGIDPEGDHSQETIVVIGIEVQVIADQGQDPVPVLIRIG